MGSIPPSPDWRLLYELALSETDRCELPHRVSAARGAILRRVETRGDNPSPSELRAMENALKDLQRLAEMMVAGEVA